MQFIRSQVPRESGPVPQARSCLGLAVCRCWTGWQLNLFQFCSWLSTVPTARRCGFDSREKPWRCSHRHLMGRKPPAPAHRSDGARPSKPCGARHSAKRRRLAHRVRGKELRVAIDGKGGEDVAMQRREAPTEPRDRRMTGLDRRSVRRLPFRGPGL